MCSDNIVVRASCFGRLSLMTAVKTPATLSPGIEEHEMAQTVRDIDRQRSDRSHTPQDGSVSYGTPRHGCRIDGQHDGGVRVDPFDLAAAVGRR